MSSKKRLKRSRFQIEMRPFRKSLKSAKVDITRRGSIVEMGSDRGWCVLEKVEVLEARED